MKYTRLSEEERWHIEVHYSNGKSIGWISRCLGRAHSTISRELARNSTVHGYKASQACTMSTNRLEYRNTQRRKLHGSFQELVISKLKECWSPEQISGWLEVNGHAKVSHETIYQFVYGAVGRRQNLKQYLRHGGRKYQKRSKQKYAGRGYIPGRIDIDDRPNIVEEKSRIGDWELDTIVGEHHQGYIVSMVDRMTKYTKLAFVENAKAVTVKKAIIQALKPHTVHTLTADNGKEFAQHNAIATKLKADFYFAKPYHSWERGLNEHTNGLVRQFLPKKTNFLKTLTPQKLQHIENLLNNRPRKVLHFKSPMQVFSSA